jgi:hypothetical protein
MHEKTSLKYPLDRMRKKGQTFGKRDTGVRVRDLRVRSGHFVRKRDGILGGNKGIERGGREV